MSEDCYSKCLKTLQEESDRDSPRSSSKIIFLSHLKRSLTMSLSAFLEVKISGYEKKEKTL